MSEKAEVNTNTDDLEVEANVTLKIELDIESLGSATGSMFDDHLLPIREAVTATLEKTRQAHQKAVKRLEKLGDKVSAGALAKKKNGISGVKEFQALADSYNKVNGVRKSGTRYEVALSDAHVDVDNSVIRGKLVVRDVIEKKHYHGDSAYHDEIVEMFVELKFTADMKMAAKDIEDTAKSLEEAQEHDRAVTHLVAQRHKVVERTKRLTTMLLLSGKKATRQALVKCGEEAIAMTIRTAVKALPKSYQKMLPAPSKD